MYEHIYTHMDGREEGGGGVEGAILVIFLNTYIYAHM